MDGESCVVVYCIIDCSTAMEVKPDNRLDGFFSSAGIAEYSTKLIEASGAKSPEDFLWLDTTSLDQVICAAGLLPISASKFRYAIQVLTLPPLELSAPPATDIAWATKD